MAFYNMILLITIGAIIAGVLLGSANGSQAEQKDDVREVCASLSSSSSSTNHRLSENNNDSSCANSSTSSSTTKASSIPLKFGIEWSQNSIGVPIATFRSTVDNNNNNDLDLDVDSVKGVTTKDLMTFLDDTGKDEIRKEYKKSGAVILRGFPFGSSDIAEAAFEFLVDHRPGGGTLHFLPDWLRSAIRKLVMYVMFNLVDDGRGYDMKSLRRATSNVQGPHQELNFMSWRNPHVALYCEVPPLADGETGIYDAGAAYNALSEETRNVITQYQYYYYLYSGFLYEMLPRWAHTMIMNASLVMFNQFPSWNPLVLRSPTSSSSDGDDDDDDESTSDNKYLQWNPFGNRLTDIAAETFQEHYPERGPVTGDPDYAGEYMVRLNPKAEIMTAAQQDDVRRRKSPSLLLDKKTGNSSDNNREYDLFTEKVEREIAKSFFARHSLVKWQKNDLVILDNIRWAHGRVNGITNASRKIQFFQAEPLIPVQEFAVV